MSLRCVVYGHRYRPLTLVQPASKALLAPERISISSLKSSKRLAIFIVDGMTMTRALSTSKQSRTILMSKK